MGTADTGWQVTLDATDEEAYAVLARDRVWNCFALADLEPPFRAYSQVAIARQDGSEEGGACLVVRHPALTVVSPYGADAGVAAILARLALPRQTLIQAQAAHLPLLEKYYRFLPGWRELLRMGVSAGAFRPPASMLAGVVERLTLNDLAGLHDLYALYPENHFRDDLLREGVFYGVRAGQRVIAAGGTHVVARGAGIAVLGNILTHPDARRQGYATAITAVLAAELFAQGCRDVVLNVVAENEAAIRVYTRLGFERHCSFWRGQAELKGQQQTFTHPSGIIG
jgi:ribosomal protein S18 acetylase RimI-like enzyme